MSNDWEVEDTKSHLSEAMGARFMEMATARVLGDFPEEKTYVMKNKETGERKEVMASDKEEAGKKVSKGNWD